MYLKYFFLFIAHALFFIGFSNELDVFLNVKRYYNTIENEQYIELSYFIPANMVAYKKNESNMYQAQVLVAIQLLNNNKEQAFKYTYILKSANYDNLDASIVNLTDIINIPFLQDSVDLNIQFLDLNDSTSYFTDNIPLHKLIVNDGFLSDISLIRKVKIDTNREPFPESNQPKNPKYLNYYPTENNEMNFHVESYTIDSNQIFFIKYFISDENNMVLNKYANFKKIPRTNRTTIVKSGFNISKLPSGNYYVYVELRNDSNAIVDRKRIFFQRQNKSTAVLDRVSKHELSVINNNFAKKYDLVNISHHLRALKPVAEGFESAAIDGAINSGEINLMHNYFYSFWYKRNKTDPEQEWKKYAEKVQYVENEFSNSLIEGHETSRGKVYLKYGKPYERLQRNTAQYGRIEIWTYEQINKQGNVIFLFVENPISDNEFPLVHSTLNTELYNKEWDTILKNNNF